MNIPIEAKYVFWLDGRRYATTDQPYGYTLRAMLSPERVDYALHLAYHGTPLGRTIAQGDEIPDGAVIVALPHAHM